LCLFVFVDFGNAICGCILFIFSISGSVILSYKHHGAPADLLGRITQFLPAGVISHCEFSPSSSKGGGSGCLVSRRRGRLPEADPGYDDYERGGDVDLDEVVSHRSHKLELTGQTGVVAYTSEL
jgi:hypothetical protein